MERRTVNILGTKWTILIGTEGQFPGLKGSDGYTDDSIKTIVVDEMVVSKDDVRAKKNLKEYQKTVIRHEIVHAFFYESGLASNTANVKSWAQNEEMVDWIAIQLPKIIDACKEAQAL